MDVYVADEQASFATSPQRLVSLARCAGQCEGVDARAELSIMLVDAESMSALKEQYLGESGPTDVLAFPIDESPVHGDRFMLGDIVICPDVASGQAEQAGHSLSDELDLLLVHGFLHLIGYDHTKPADARTMRHRERQILDEFKRGVKTQ